MSARISKHISLKEATRSNTAQRLGIDNFPTNDVLIKMQLTANKIFEPLREYVDCPIKHSVLISPASTGTTSIPPLMLKRDLVFVFINQYDLFFFER